MSPPKIYCGSVKRKKKVSSQCSTRSSPASKPIARAILENWRTNISDTEEPVPLIIHRASGESFDKRLWLANARHDASQIKNALNEFFLLVIYSNGRVGFDKKTKERYLQLFGREGNF